jgi:hypothetical protein
MMKIIEDCDTDGTPKITVIKYFAILSSHERTVVLDARNKLKWSTKSDNLVVHQFLNSNLSGALEITVEWGRPENVYGFERRLYCSVS